MGAGLSHATPAEIEDEIIDTIVSYPLYPPELLKEDRLSTYAAIIGALKIEGMRPITVV